MKNVITLIVSSLFSLFLGAQLAGANDDTQYRNLGQCMAYTAIKSGLDGANELSPFTAETLAKLGDEFMFEASLLGISEEDAQYFVVGRLIDYNIMIKEDDPATLIKEHDGVCRELIRKLSSGR